MKKLLVLLPLLFVLCSAQAQKFEKCDSISLETTEGINAAEPCIMELAKYIISQPVNEKGDLMVSAQAVLVTWMMKTPNYTFTLYSEPAEMSKGKNKQLFGIYMACIAKAALKKGSDGAEAEGIKLFVKYLKDPDNGVKMTKKVKKYLAAQEG